MDKNELKSSLKPSDIERVLKYYNVDFFYNNQEAMQIETACHNRHGGSHKLYYYPDTCTFHCYTDCGENFDIYELLMKISATRGETINFNEAIQNLGVILGINVNGRMKRKKGFGDSNQSIGDWDWIDKLKRRKVHKPEFEYIDESVLNEFKEWYTLDWLEEGISLETQEKYGIRFYPEKNQTVIPHYDIDNNLIGIRSRTWRHTEKGKYYPLYYDGKGYNHPLGFNLYSLNENKNAIKRNRKVVITEGEKSPMKAHSMFGEENFVVSLCGSSMNAFQAELLMNLGVERVYIAVDKDYVLEPTHEYLQKVKKIARHFVNKVNVYHLTDTRGILGYQDCMLDADKESVVSMMHYDKHQIHNLDDLDNFKGEIAWR